MKLIQSVFATSLLLAIAVSAQPAPPAPPAPSAPSAQAPKPTPIQIAPRGGQHPMPPGFGRSMNPSTPPVMPGKDKLSYAIGMYMGNNLSNNLKRDKLDVDLDTLFTAFKDAIHGVPGKMTETEMRSTLQELSGALRYRMQHEREEAMEKEATTNRIAGEEYLARNGKEPGVTTLPNGIEYKVLKEGSGPKPKPSDTVAVAYAGRLINGTEFDHNNEFKTPVTGRTIRGWSEVLPLMNVGSKWQVTIPADLAYGQHGMPPRIPPAAVLVFDIELLSIEKPTAAASMQPPGPARTSTPVVSGQIIKVPSAEELKHGAKIEVITNAPGQ